MKVETRGDPLGKDGNRISKRWLSRGESRHEERSEVGCREECRATGGQRWTSEKQKLQFNCGQGLWHCTLEVH